MDTIILFGIIFLLCAVVFVGILPVYVGANDFWTSAVSGFLSVLSFGCAIVSGSLFIFMNMVHLTSLESLL